eukprot:jgi/Psemu1/28941/gm1.28941_g
MKISTSTSTSTTSTTSSPSPRRNQQQSMKRFVAAASSLSALSSFGFASARIGKVQRPVAKEAPQAAAAAAAAARQRHVQGYVQGYGYDPTAPTFRTDKNQYPRANTKNTKNTNKHSHSHSHSINIHEAIHDALKEALAEDDYAESTLRNTNSNNINSNNNNDGNNNDIDTGILDGGSFSGTTKNERPTTTTTTTSLEGEDEGCMIRYGDGDDGHFVFEPAGVYLQRQIDQEGGFYWNVLFDPLTNTITCTEDQTIDEDNNEDNVVTTNARGCSSLEFRNCPFVRCIGRESCFGTVIRNADVVECHGPDACLGAEIDALDIDCYGDRACFDAELGLFKEESLESLVSSQQQQQQQQQQQLSSSSSSSMIIEREVETIRCHGKSTDTLTCARSKTHAVKSVLCSGLSACAEAELVGVRSSGNGSGNGSDGDGDGDDDGSGYGLICEGDNACEGVRWTHQVEEIIDEEDRLVEGETYDYAQLKDDDDDELVDDEVVDDDDHF